MSVVIKDSLEKKEKNPLGEYRVVCLLGNDDGAIYSFDGDILRVHDRFVVERGSGLFLLKSSTDRELMVEGEFTMESLIEPGDVIVTEDSEYRFELYSVGKEKARRGLQVLGLFALIAVLIIFFMPFFANVFTGLGSDLKNQNTIGSKINDGDSSLVEKQTKEYTKSERNRILAKARLRYEVAKSYARESELNAGYLLWAVTEFETIKEDLRDIEPKPDILNSVEKRLIAARELLLKKKKTLALQAMAASRIGDQKLYDSILHELMSITQDPSAPYYQWAQQRLKQGE